MHVGTYGHYKSRSSSRPSPVPHLSLQPASPLVLVIIELRFHLFFVDIAKMPSATTAAPATSQSSKSRIPSSLVAFPSVSQSLHSLSSATSVHGVSLHPSSFAQYPAQSEAKLEVALSKNLAVAKQRQQEEQERRLREMKDAARLRMLEEQRQQATAESSSPLTMKTRKPKAN
ncbi:hypothetical protein D9756_007121 [Leucocoprinus leucothites]|uniref:Uncharacterized protein n=1 Tax=Leucocoprinus leucothites TaxID=201217 RepID=A0A8H5D6L0_9AGAR|nr:hypothetical protein D9756_007121 [Leucoagaricus leucothites]